MLAADCISDIVIVSFFPLPIWREGTLHFRGENGKRSFAGISLGTWKGRGPAEPNKMFEEAEDKVVFLHTLSVHYLEYDIDVSRL
ncbi:unnamed protein product [Sphenostylis stenocarpa]|uniref:Uncharacterized protein n=1 Tax=Sphenostylis stenocarpa TaxID=92480 RepID=A0AA86S9X9_9FABA|nr:unnamed protein product [Sphenostylis stenocarpa]